MRRALAEKLGADHLIDPREGSGYAELARVAPGRTAVIFECVGVPGMLQEILKSAPAGARVVVVGVCMQEDRIKPMLAISKELQLQFVLGYLPGEFAETLGAIAEGKLDVAPLITGRVYHAELMPDAELIVTDGQGDAGKQSADVDDMIAQGIDVLLRAPRTADG